MRRFVLNIIKFLGIFTLSALCVVLFDYFCVGNRHLGNYEAAILDKEARFKSLKGPKIVLLGNSNLAFGMDSERLSDALDMPVVNMAMHGGLGSAFNENLIRLGDISQGDIVVLAHHTYSDDDTVEDPALEMITIEKHRDLWKLVRPKDIPGLIRVYPDYFKDCLTLMLTSEDDNTPEDTTCYSRSAFNEYGDVDRRLEYDERVSFAPGMIELPAVNDICTARINRLNKYVSDRGGVLLIAAYPIAYGEYTPAASGYDEFEEALRNSVDCDVISHFTDYFIPYDMFYDTKYHLDKEGVRVRTDLLISDITMWKDKREELNK